MKKNTSIYLSIYTYICNVHVLFRYTPMPFRLWTSTPTWILPKWTWPPMRALRNQGSRWSRVLRGSLSGWAFVDISQAKLVCFLQVHIDGFWKKSAWVILQQISWLILLILSIFWKEGHCFFFSPVSFFCQCLWSKSDRSGGGRHLGGEAALRRCGSIRIACDEVRRLVGGEDP